ncbi:hypothetical protein CsSME_00023488 [Camellia sinensis var. sinensis]
MASSTSTATSSWPPRMCDCGFGHCVVRISRSAKNPGRAYYVCPRTTRCVAWVGWCDKFRSTRLGTNQPHNDVDLGLRADVTRIDQSLRQHYSWQQTDHLPVPLQSLEMNNQCAKFKSKPLENVDLMERVYSGAAAIGKHTWTPTKVRDAAAAATNANEDNGMGPLGAGTPL